MSVSRTNLELHLLPLATTVAATDCRPAVCLHSCRRLRRRCDHRHGLHPIFLHGRSAFPAAAIYWHSPAHSVALQLRNLRRLYHNISAGEWVSHLFLCRLRHAGDEGGFCSRSRVKAEGTLYLLYPDTLYPPGVHLSPALLVI